MRPRFLFLGIWVGALALSGAGCQNDLLCGEGTVELNDECVPSDQACGDGTHYDEATGKCESDSACGDGTVLVEGECVPDGTVVCGDGTVFDADLGECVPDQTCGEGTVLVDGECIPYDDAVVADVNENPEPNGFDDDGAGQFTLPEIGENVTIKGCVDPYEGVVCSGDNLDPDFDAYYFVATGPTLLEVSVDGLNGLSGGFAMLPTDQQLNADGWLRFGINPIDDLATRQVFLPKAGTYALGITDGRSILFAEGFGGPDDCYLATVQVLPMPAPTPMASTTATGDLGDVAFYSYPDVQEGDLLFPSVGAPSEAAQGALVAMVNNAYRNSGTGAETLPDGPGVITAGMHADDLVVFAVDHIYNYSLSAVPYTLRVQDHSAQQLPDSFSSVDLVNSSAESRPSWLYFDVAQGGDVLRLQLVGDDEFMAVMIDPWRGELLGEFDIDSDSGEGGDFYFTDEWSHLPRPDRFYIAVINVDPAQNPTFSMAGDSSAHTPGVMAIGTDLLGETLSNDSSNWYTLDVTGHDWVWFQHYQESFNGQFEAAAYELDRFGVLNDGTEFDQYQFQDTDDFFGRVTRGAEVTQLLVRVTDTGGSTGSEFDVYPRDRNFMDITVDESTPFSATGIDFDDFFIQFALVTAPERDYRLDLVVTPTDTSGTGEDMLFAELNGNEDLIFLANEGGNGAAESMSTATGRQNMAIFGFVNLNSGGSFSLDIDATVPFYSAAPGTVAFVDACDCGANEVALTDDWGFPDDDEGYSEAIATDGDFLFADTATGDLYVYANGFIGFDTAGLYPFLTDLYRVTACVKQEADKVTIQWNGELCNWDGAQCLGGPPAQVQLVLHDDDTFDYIYGPDHALDSSSAQVIGLESEWGTRTISDGDRGLSEPDTSYTFSYNVPPS